jgi:SecD/SecF fusion protein
MSVIVALIHDVMIVLGLAAIMGAVAGWEISALFISAMLTVIGFSTHDTIVIFDRIRENLRKPLPNEDMGMLVNRSITQSIARSINTSGTVVVTLILLIFVGSATPELKLFNAAMLAGILSGTYSSIFNAAPILYLWDRAVGRKKGEHNTMIAISRNLANQVRITQPATAPTQGAAPTAPGAGAPSGGAYGQTKRRRASDAEKGIQSIDD